MAAIVAALRATAAAAGDADAVVGCDGGACTRAQLTAVVGVVSRALRLRTHLHDFVALRLPRSAALLASTLAAIDAGVSFAYTDPAVPLSYYVTAWRAARVSPLLVVSAQASAADASGVAVVSIEVLVEEADVAAPFEAEPRRGTRADELYIAATSGSSAQARLVSGSATGTLNRLAWMAASAQLRLAPDDVVLLRTPPAFVDSITEALAPAVAGAVAVVLPGGAPGTVSGQLDAWFCAVARAAASASPPPALVIGAAPRTTAAPQPLVEDLSALLRLVRDRRVTRLTATPQLLDALLALAAHAAGGGRGGGGSADPSPLASLRVVVSSGDVLRAGTVRRWAAHFAPRPPPELVNLYGSAETSADATWSAVFADAPWRARAAATEGGGGNSGGAGAEAAADVADDADSEPVPVGLPLPGVAVGIVSSGSDAELRDTRDGTDSGAVAPRRNVTWLHADGGVTEACPRTPAPQCGLDAARCRARRFSWVRPVTRLGRVVVRGVGVALGYVGVPAATGGGGDGADAHFACDPFTGERTFWTGDEGRLVAHCSGPCGVHGRGETDAPLGRSCPCGCGGALALQVVGRLAAVADDGKVRGVRVHAMQVEAAALRGPRVVRRLESPDGVVACGVPTFARFVVDAGGTPHVFVGLTWTRAPPALEGVNGALGALPTATACDMAAAAATRAHMLAHLPPAAVPARAHVHVLTHARADDVPDTAALPPRVPLLPSGKPSTAALVAMARAAASGGSTSDDADAVTRRVRSAFAAALRVDARAIADDLDFFDAGGDSLGAVRLVTNAELELAAAAAIAAVSVGVAAPLVAAGDGACALVRRAVTFDALLRCRTPAAVAALLRSAAASAARELQQSVAGAAEEPSRSGGAAALASSVHIVEEDNAGMPPAASTLAVCAGAERPPPPSFASTGARTHTMRVWTRAAPAAVTWRCPGSVCAAQGPCEWALEPALPYDGDGALSERRPLQSGAGDAASSGERRAAAVDAPTVMWDVDLRGCVDASALVVSRAHSQMPDAPASALAIVGAHSGDVVAVDVASGRVAWRVTLPDHVEGAAALHPWSYTAVVPCFDGRVYGLCVDSGATRWCYPPLPPADTGTDRRRHRERSEPSAATDPASAGGSGSVAAPGGAPPDPIKATPWVDPDTRLVWVVGYGRTLHVVRVPAGGSAGVDGEDPHVGGGGMAVRKRRATPDVHAAVLPATLVASADVDGSVAASPVPVQWCDDGARHGGVAVATTVGTVTVFYRGHEDGIACAPLAVVWSRRVPAPVFGTPAVLQADGCEVLCVPTADGTLHALAAATGTALWRYAASAALVSAPCAIRCAQPPVLVLGSHDGVIHALDARGAAVWTTMAVAAVATPSTPCACAVGVVPRARGGAVIVAVTQEGVVRVIDAATGAPAAGRVRLPAPSFAAPVAVPAALAGDDGDALVVLAGGRDDHFRALRVLV